MNRSQFESWKQGRVDELDGNLAEYGFCLKAAQGIVDNAPHDDQLLINAAMDLVEQIKAAEEEVRRDRSQTADRTFEDMQADHEYDRWKGERDEC